jgi:NAD(P)-dependent dehydrogenase (short-subunit alcohol dehydrogenase family)
MNLKGKVVIVTGGGRGIGRAIAAAYSSEGASVVIAESDPVTGKETEAYIQNKGGIAVFLRTDVRRSEEIIKLMDFTREHYGRIDILINNAGYGKWISPYELTVEDWDDVINTNLRSVFLCSREAGRIMRGNGGGSIVNIASTRAFMSEPHSEAYAASKGGIVALTHALAASFSKDHIMVNCISPGWIETGDYDKLSEADHRQHFSGRVGRPDDIARACLYLTSGGNDFINGANLVIDGGMTKKMIYEE